MKVLLLLGLLLALPGASACQSVFPLLDLEFPEKAPCPRNEPDVCSPVPEAGQSISLDGVLHWRWDLDNCGATSFSPSNEDVVVTFESYARNPEWLTVSVEPASVTISFQDQWDIQDDELDPVAGTFNFREEYPVTATITRVGDPAGEDLERLWNREGLTEVIVRVRSSETDMFDPSFTIEAFGFDARPLLHTQDADTNGAPGVALPLLGGALVAVAAVLRRRQT